MKKTYLSPVMEVLSFAKEDIVTASPVELEVNEGDLISDAEKLFGEGGIWG